MLLQSGFSLPYHNISFLMFLKIQFWKLYSLWLKRNLMHKRQAVDGELNRKFSFKWDFLHKNSNIGTYFSAKKFF